MVGTPKTAHLQRVIPLPEMLMEGLKVSFQDLEADKYIFSETAQTVEPRTVQRRLEQLTKRLGIQGDTNQSTASLAV